MEKVSKATFILILLIATTLLSPLPAKSESSEKRFTITMTVTYTNNGANPWNLTGEDYAISLFMNNSWQSVSLVEHSLPLISVENDTDGNPLGLLNLPQLNQSQTVNYTVKYDVISKPRLLPSIAEEQSLMLADINNTLKDVYCKKEGPWLIDDPYLKGNATEIAGNETRVLSIVKKFVKIIHKNITYDSEEIPRYPNETITQQAGDCDDQAILLITLCRIVGIPAYLQVGCIFQLDPFPRKEEYWKDAYGHAHVTSTLRQIAWHGWAIVYIPPWGWLPVDLTYVPIDPYLIDPLNAIKGAAVTGQDVIQYMNFTHTDYVGASRRFRDFMWNNNLYIEQVDEMRMNIDFGTIWELIELLFRGALTAITIVAVLLAAIFIYKWKKSGKAHS